MELQAKELGSDGGTFAKAATPIDAKTLVPPPAAKEGKGGEGGKLTPSTAFTPSNRAFLEKIFAELPEGARVAVTAKPGDPQAGGWPAFDGNEVDERCGPDLNTYINCASFWLGGDGFQARNESIAAYHALVLDDVGTKVDRDLLGDTEPTWELETSPGNYQVGYRISPLLSDPAEVQVLQQAIKAAGLTDKGALGMNRWVRLPNGINGKQKHKDEQGRPFQCKLTAWNPERAYTAEDLERELVSDLAEKVHPNQPASAPAAIQPRSQIGVFRPGSEENPVVSAFKHRKLYKRLLSLGRHDVICPWISEHTDQLDTGTAYFEPSEEYPDGGFVCQHSHKDTYHLRELLDHFGLTKQEARNRPTIRIVSGEIPAILAAAERQLAKREDLYHAGNVIVTVRKDPATGDMQVVPLSEPALTLTLSKAADWEKFDGRSKEWKRCDPPPRHVSLLYKAQEYRFLPELRGLARQPYLDGAGHLVTGPGYNPETLRLGIFPSDKFPAIETTKHAAEEALAALRALLAEFHFAGEVDEAAALAAILTAVVRPSLPVAPAFHVSAPSSGSGKSYLCEVIALFAGPGGAARLSYPRTSEEATKSMLSVLMPNPPVVEFDDMDCDWLPHGAINRMLTSSRITDRVLGVSKVATVGTQTLVLGSGNNVGPIKDMLRRVVTIRLNSRTEVPGTITYKGNPVAALKKERERYVSAALTIVEAWKAAGCPKTNVPSIASYGGEWADYCRHPLIWLGLTDPATSLLEQMKSDPDADNLRRLLEAWHETHGDRTLTIRKLLTDLYEGDLFEALMELPVIDRGQMNRSKLGHYFKRSQDRVVGGLVLQKVENAERNAWRVVKALPQSTGDMPLVSADVRAELSAPP